MMDENRRLDDELAALTDAMLEKRDMNTSHEVHELADVVRGLYTLIEPGERPSPKFEARLKQSLNQEWEQRTRRARRGRFSPALRLAAVLVVALVAIVLLNSTTPSGQGLPGTAVGSNGAIVILITLAAVAGVALLVWRGRR
jgi:hypothetical protein